MDQRPATSAIDDARDRQNLLLVYQPIHDALTGRIVSAEALLRQRRESGELREAGLITSGAEEENDSSELFRLDSWVVRQAYTDLARWRAAGVDDVRLNVNLSPREVTEKDMRDRLTGLLTSCGVATDDVNLEITETSYIEGPAAVAPFLGEIRDLGIHLWLDDFGTGHSSIEHLLHFPLEGLKIPSTFVKHLVKDVRARSICRRLIALAHDLSMKVTAEGIEHQAQLSFLTDNGCDFIQGFLFSRPMIVEEFLEHLEARSDVAGKKSSTGMNFPTVEGRS